MEAKFYLYRKQHGEGCDYTIGCGRSLDVLKAQTLAEALVEASTFDLDDDSEQQLDDAMIFASPVHTFNTSFLRDVKKQRVQNEKDKAVVIAERAELERLQKKYAK